jgi:hypothetical protein
MIPQDQRHTEESSSRLYTAVPVDQPTSTTYQVDDNVDMAVLTQAPDNATDKDLQNMSSYRPIPDIRIQFYDFRHPIVGFVGTFCSDQHADEYLYWRLENGPYVYSHS